MADQCCAGKSGKTALNDPKWRRILWFALIINAAMFGVEIVAGVAADSRALQADALDFLGDSANYAISLGVAGMALAWRARAAEADRIIGAVAQEIERVGLKRARIRGDPGSDLDTEHRGIDDQREPQDAPPSGIIQRGLAAFAGTTLIGHRRNLLLSSIRHPICSL